MTKPVSIPIENPTLRLVHEKPENVVPVLGSMVLQVPVETVFEFAELANREINDLPCFFLLSFSNKDETP